MNNPKSVHNWKIFTSHYSTTVNIEKQHINRTWQIVWIRQIKSCGRCDKPTEIPCTGEPLRSGITTRRCATSGGAQGLGAKLREGKYFLRHRVEANFRIKNEKKFLSYVLVSYIFTLIRYTICSGNQR